MINHSSIIVLYIVKNIFSVYDNKHEYWAGMNVYQHLTDKLPGYVGRYAIPYM